MDRCLADLLKDVLNETVVDELSMLNSAQDRIEEHLMEIKQLLVFLVKTHLPKPEEEEEEAEDYKPQEQDILGFLEKYFATEHRLPLMDIVKKYKEVYKVKLTRAQMKELIEPFGWKITNLSGRWWATRVGEASPAPTRVYESE